MSSKWASCVAFYLSNSLWEDFHERFDEYGKFLFCKRPELCYNVVEE
jgi:hypothetical protein